MTADPEIEGFHAHVYFDADGVDAAEALCRAASERFGLEMGRLHAKPIGPHPRGSCQLSVPPETFADTLVWLLMNRGAHTVFVHALTGNHLRDHTQGAMWLGASETLDLSIFDTVDTD